MKTNLLLLDSYNNIEELLSYAFSFSNRSKRGLKIIYVFDFSWMMESYMVSPGAPVDPALVAVEKNAQKEFKVAEKKIRETAADYLKKHSVNVPFEIHISEINRIDVVQEEYEKNRDLILLISNQQSYSKATGGLIGYPNLVEHVKCPVFVIPEHAEHSVMNDIVYATDYHPEDIESLQFVKKLLNANPDLNFTILHNQPDYDFIEKLKWSGFQTLVKNETEIEDPTFTLFSEKSTVKAIEKYAEQYNPDLLIILKERKGFFRQLFNSSETKSVLTHLNKPVLVFHEK